MRSRTANVNLSINQARSNRTIKPNKDSKFKLFQNNPISNSITNKNPIFSQILSRKISGNHIIADNNIIAQKNFSLRIN